MSGPDLIRPRPATDDDVAAICAIYNQSIVGSHVSFDTEPWTVESRREWFAHYGGDTPWQVWVATEGAAVVGAAWSSRYRPRAAYDSSVETTIVIDADATGRGVGARLYGALLDDLDARDVHRAYAVVALPNDASVALHRRCGFETLSVQDEVGFKLGRWWSTMLLQRRHPRHGPPAPPDQPLSAGAQPR